MTQEALPLPRAVVWQRLHSLTGLWFVLFLLEHLFTNSQAALFFGDDGMWFVRSVNFLHNLPYLPLIELFLLGVPFGYHAILGVRYLFTSRPNTIGASGRKPKLNYARNWAYTFQRISAWILLFGLILHVWYMRFDIYPAVVKQGSQSYYFANYQIDDGLYPLADRLDVKLYDEEAIEREKEEISKQLSKMELVRQKLQQIEEESSSGKYVYNAETDSVYKSWQAYMLKMKYVLGLESKPLKKGQVVAVSTNFGNIILLNVREAFKSVTKAIFYTLFVLAACFHAFNGLWTFLITWGVLLSKKAQHKMVGVCYAIMGLMAFLGLMSIWGSYFVNLRN
ncbi:MAG: succinate dehydrogenase [Chlamydiae bacterium]|nr:succinate dehydrogenase [Chlamydiota bacterium]